MPLRLTWTGYRWELSTRNKAEYDAAKAVGFHYDWKQKLAWTGLNEVAQKYREFADSKAAEKFTRQDEHIKVSKAMSPEEIGMENIEIPVPEGLAYLPFQKAGIISILARLGFNLESLKKIK